MNEAQLLDAVKARYDAFQNLSDLQREQLPPADFVDSCRAVIFHAALVERDAGAISFLRFGPGERNSRIANDWRQAVFERDNFTCRDCGARGQLHAHHVEHWALAPALRFSVSNGLTLCVECHAARHHKHANLIRKAHYHRGPTA